MIGGNVGRLVSKALMGEVAHRSASPAMMTLVKSDKNQKAARAALSTVIGEPAVHGRIAREILRDITNRNIGFRWAFL
jgi:hypothetical protein